MGKMKVVGRDFLKKKSVISPILQDIYINKEYINFIIEISFFDELFLFLRVKY